MNLLYDKRDQERSEPLPDFNVFQTEDFNPEDYARAKPIIPRSKSGHLVLQAVSAAVVITAIVAGYYLGVVKPKKVIETAQTVTVAEEPPASAQQPPEPSSVPATADTGVQRSAAEETPTPLQVSEESVTIPADNLPGLAALLLKIIPQDCRIGAVIVDQATFSLEVSTPSSAAAAALFNTYSNALPAALQLTSPPPSEAAFLVTGAVRLERSYGASLTLGQWESKLGATAAGTGLSVLTMTPETSRLFAKFSGRMEAVQSFLIRLASDSEQPRVNKLIIMPSSGGNMTLVLRLAV